MYVYDMLICVNMCIIHRYTHVYTIYICIHVHLYMYTCTQTRDCKTCID